ncbi:MAG: hypothetical protein JWM87_158 [Candidatus Eremiobacteraeota bacterium]|nr:hypothetical protein [Candidatus Eremiobacteraeota bacterium]
MVLLLEVGLGLFVLVSLYAAVFRPGPWRESRWPWRRRGDGNQEAGDRSPLIPRTPVLSGAGAKRLCEDD